MGSQARVIVLRDGGKKTLMVTIEQLPEEDRPLASNDQPRPAPSNPMGIEVAELDSETMKELGRGVQVKNVQPGSPAAVSGLRKGDIVLQLDRKNVKNVADFSKKVANLPTGRMIPVLVHRQGADQFIVMKIAEAE